MTYVFRVCGGVRDSVGEFTRGRVASGQHFNDLRDFRFGNRILMKSESEGIEARNHFLACGKINREGVHSKEKATLPPRREQGVALTEGGDDVA